MSTPQATLAPTPNARSTPPPRVLCVDDNVDACTMLGLVLRMQGYEVQMAHTGLGALASAMTWRPDVVLLDIGLPGIDGYEVARRLRAEPATRTARLVALTGHGNAEDLQLGREAGFDAHLLKPADPSEVETLLAGWKEPSLSSSIRTPPLTVVV